MSDKAHLEAAPELRTYPDKVRAIATHIRTQAARFGPLEILEAGCGTRWDIKLSGVQYRLTGIDSDQAALDQRMNLQRDMDRAVLADLRTVVLPDCSFDIVFCSDVLEHVPGAEAVLANFARWLKPGGIMILAFPNRDSSYAFLTRVTPLRAHIAFKKYLQGYAAAGRPGSGPFPTVFDEVVSRKGIRSFASRHGLIVRAEYRRDQPLVRNRWVWGAVHGSLWLVHVASAGRLSVDHRSLLYVIEKPE